MLNKLTKLVIRKFQRWCGAHLGQPLLIMMLTQVVCGVTFAQHTHILLQDRKVLVTEIDLRSGERYSPPEDGLGAVWTVLDPALLITKKDGVQSSKQIKPGDAETVGQEERLVFISQNGQRVRLITVKPKTPHQDLTVGPFLTSSSLEDGSDRNATLLVAVSSSRFKDTRNLGDESEWVLSKPTIVAMQAGSVRWIRPGIHHFKNLGPPSKLVSIEW